jgi:hypothetical protein
MGNSGLDVADVARSYSNDETDLPVPGQLVSQQHALQDTKVVLCLQHSNHPSLSPLALP